MDRSEFEFTCAAGKEVGGEEGRRNMSKEPFEIGDTWDQVGMLSQLSPDSSQTQAAADAVQLGQAGITWYYSAHSWRFRDL
jgi:hypothetical protein